MFNIV
jgi:hypothetical protein